MMQKLETRNGTLVFVEVPESVPLSYYYHDGYDILGEVTKDAITFDCREFVQTTKFQTARGLEIVYADYTKKHPLSYYESTLDSINSSFISLMQSQGIELKEGKKFIVLKEKQDERVL
jgi:hypothetical protein